MSHIAHGVGFVGHRLMESEADQLVQGHQLYGGEYSD